jgi:hypothetical protein
VFDGSYFTPTMKGRHHRQPKCASTARPHLVLADAGVQPVTLRAIDRYLVGPDHPHLVDGYGAGTIIHDPLRRLVGCWNWVVRDSTSGALSTTGEDSLRGPRSERH